MNRILFAVGIFLALIWTAVAFISFGLPGAICNVIKTVTFGAFSNAINNLHNGFYYDVPNKNMPTAIFLVLFSFAFFFYFAVAVKIDKYPDSAKSFLIVIIFSILFRLILLPSIAIHESDFYRYLWDGKSFKNGINPFKYAPAELNSAKAETNQEINRLKELRDNNPLYFERINHSGVPTIYPPAAQAVFAISSIIKEDSIFVLKSIFVFFDILAVILIGLLLLHFKMNPALSLIYGWSPLVLKEIGNSGHYDSITIFLVLFSLFFLVKNKALSGTIILVCASLLKFYPVLLLPLYMRRIKLSHLAAFAIGIIGMYVPFFIWNHTGIEKVFAGLNIYSQKWAYNGSLFVVVQSVFDGLHFRVLNEFFLAKLVTGLIFISIIFYLTRKKGDAPLLLMKRSFFILTALFLLNPVGEPWYFCWVIPFLCFFPYRSLLLLSWLLIFSYLSFNHDFAVLKTGNLDIPLLSAIQYVPFLIFFIWEFVIKKRYALDYV